MEILKTTKQTDAGLIEIGYLCFFSDTQLQLFLEDLKDIPEDRRSSVTNNILDIVTTL